MWSKDTLIIAILTFCTVVLWIFFDAYHTYKTSTIPKELKEEIKEFDPKLDTKVIEELKKRPTGFEAPTPSEEEKGATESGEEATKSGEAMTPTTGETLTPTLGENQ